jgi:hypothetical protein
LTQLRDFIRDQAVLEVDSAKTSVADRFGESLSSRLEQPLNALAGGSFVGLAAE